MELKELIEVMSGAKDGKEPVGSKTASWAAFRKAEQLKDLDLIPQLKAYVEDKGNESTRKYAYDILGYIGINTGSNEVADILIGRMQAEDHYDDILHNLLDSLYSTNFPLQKGLEEMLAYAFDERELIRTTAIQLLSRYTIGHDKIKEALLEVVEYHYDEYDLRYAVESLQVLFPNDCRKWVLGVKEDLESKGGDQLIVDRIGVVLMSLA